MFISMKKFFPIAVLIISIWIIQSSEEAIHNEELVGWSVCFTSYQPFSGHLTPNYVILVGLT